MRISENEVQGVTIVEVEGTFVSSGKSHPDDSSRAVCFTSPQSIIKRRDPEDDLLEARHPFNLSLGTINGNAGFELRLGMRLSSPACGNWDIRSNWAARSLIHKDGFVCIY